MKLVTLSLAVMVLASTCKAQERAAWLFEVVGGPVTPANPSVTVRVWAGFPANDWAFATALFSVTAAEAEWSSPFLIPFGPGSWTGRPGVVLGGSVDEIHCTQYNFGSFFANRDNPVAVWEAVWTARDFTPRDVLLTTKTGLFMDWLVTGPAGSRLDVLDEGRGFIRVVPAPGAAALAALALMLVPRRRRRWNKDI